MSVSRFYHNAKCSKARQALTLLESHGVEPEIIRYLDNPPSVPTLITLSEKLGGDPRAMMRTKEPKYAELGLGDPRLVHLALLTAISEHPILLERPIFVNGDRAILGRPPEKVLELI